MSNVDERTRRKKSQIAAQIAMQAMDAERHERLVIWGVATSTLGHPFLGCGRGLLLYPGQLLVDGGPARSG
jgi:hypothetical protein